MEIAVIVLSVLLAVMAVAVSVPKLRLQGTAWTALRSRGLKENQVRAIGVAELAGGLGLLVGLFWSPLAIASAIGLLLLGLAAVGFHVMHGDYGNPDTRAPSIPAIGLAALAAIVVAGLMIVH